MSFPTPAIDRCVPRPTPDLGTGDCLDTPTITFLGGGSASGKSSILARHLQWSEFSRPPGRGSIVVVNPDTLKRNVTGIVRPHHHGDILTHQRCTQLSEELLVSAVNQGRDIVLDGTMAWEPFVRQTIQMVRNARRFKFKRGPGYDPAIHGKPGAPEERYWEADGPQPDAVQQLPPYRVRLIGVTVEPTVGVLRAILREKETGREVPIDVLLRSYRLFASNFEGYARLVDEAVLLDNNHRTSAAPLLALPHRPALCATKRRHEALQVLDRRAWDRFLALRDYCGPDPFCLRSGLVREAR